MSRTTSWTQRFHQLVATLFIATGAYAITQSLRWPIIGDLGPGPGLFPLCLGIIMAGLSLAWLIQVSVTFDPTDVEELPRGKGWFRICVLLGAVVGFGLLLDVLGFQLAMFGLVLVIMRTLEARLIPTLIVALGAAFGIFQLFVVLDVPLPTPAIW